MNLALCYNIKHTTPSKSLNSQEEAEFDAPETIDGIQAALESGGHSVIRIEADEHAYLNFFKQREHIDMVFNFSEGLRGQMREAQIPAMLELLQIPYTHSSALSHAISLDKALTKKVLAYHNIETPKFQLVRSLTDEIDPTLRFPIMVKPNAEGSSKGIFNENLVYDKVKLKERIQFLLTNFKQPVLVEEFVGGREFTVGVLGNHPPKVLPIVEQRYDIFPENMPHFASYEAKWLFEDQLPDPHQAYHCPAPLDAQMKEKIDTISLAVWDAIQACDVIRIDMRINAQGNPSILEINTIPGMIPDPQIVSYLPVAARKAGYDFNTLVNTIVNEAAARYHLPVEKSKNYHTHLQKTLTLR